ncbi:unnamed protein product [Meloidogyne enterolobii]|uniref:Uncharacterized protein n=1 Tax=Meloidogyne enterolobii TaxID=390850 RepID=A0ACB0XTB2_MELEN
MYILMGFDRLFAIAFPIFYKNLNKKLYIIVHLTTLFIFAITIFLYGILPIFDYKNILVTGNPLDHTLFLSLINPIASVVPLVIFVISALIYLIIAILTKYVTGHFLNSLAIFSYNIAPLSHSLFKLELFRNLVF